MAGQLQGLATLCGPRIKGKALPTVHQLDSSQRRLSRTTFLLLWLLYACVGPGNSFDGWNTVTRMALAFSLAQEQSLQIDRLAPLTGDKAWLDGHYYSDKAPGQSFMAAPIVAGLTAGAKRLGWSAAPTQDGKLSFVFVLAVWLTDALTTALFAAACASAVYRSACRLGVSEPGARFGVIALGLCTPAFGWGTVVFGHMIAGGCIAIAFDNALALLSRPTRPWTALGLGLLMSLAVTVEYFSAIPMIIVALFVAAGMLGRSARASITVLGAATVGGVLGMAPLGIYNALAFGSPWTLGYSQVQGFEEMKSGVFGITYPRLWSFLSILVFPRRGILWLSPLLAVTPIAWWYMRRRWSPSVIVVLLSIPIFYILLNSSYFYWDGGWSTGPRHIMPALGAICLVLAGFWDVTGPTWRKLMVLGASISGVLNFICATVDMTDPGKVIWTVPSLVLRFWRGDVHNVFIVLGLTGLWSVVPLLILVAAIVVAAWPKGRSPYAYQRLKSLHRPEDVN